MSLHSVQADTMLSLCSIPRQVSLGARLPCEHAYHSAGSPVVSHEGLGWSCEGHDELQLWCSPILAHALLEQRAASRRRPAQRAVPQTLRLVHLDSAVLDTKQRMCVDAAHTKGACACHRSSLVNHETRCKLSLLAWGDDTNLFNSNGSKSETLAHLHCRPCCILWHAAEAALQGAATRQGQQIRRGSRHVGAGWVHKHSGSERPSGCRSCLKGSRCFVRNMEQLRCTAIKRCLRSNTVRTSSALCVAKAGLNGVEGERPFRPLLAAQRCPNGSHLFTHTRQGLRCKSTLVLDMQK